MDKQEMLTQLIATHKTFIDYINSLDEAQFTHSKDGKWTAGQQFDHIYKSIKPLTVAMALPNFMTKMMFGRANRPSRTYEEVVEKYQKKLEEGGKAPSQFLPKVIPFQKKEALLKKFKHTLNILAGQVDRFDENKLNEIIIPHPLLGKMTVREMLYFTIYHCEHHYNRAK